MNIIHQLFGEDANPNIFCNDYTNIWQQNNENYERNFDDEQKTSTSTWEEAIFSDLPQIQDQPEKSSCEFECVCTLYVIKIHSIEIKEVFNVYYE